MWVSVLQTIAAGERDECAFLNSTSSLPLYKVIILSKLQGSKKSSVVGEDDGNEIVHVIESSQNFADGMRDYWRHWVRC
jgi:hypothetical protein